MMGDSEKGWSDAFLQVELGAAKDNATRAQARVAFLEDEKARREAEAKKTMGQRTAEEMIVPAGNYHVDVAHLEESTMTHFRFAVPENGIRCDVVRVLRQSIALAIDKAVADEREKCAQKAQGWGHLRLAEAIRTQE